MIFEIRVPRVELGYALSQRVFSELKLLADDDVNQPLPVFERIGETRVNYWQILVDTRISVSSGGELLSHNGKTEPLLRLYVDSPEEEFVFFQALKRIDSTSFGFNGHFCVQVVPCRYCEVVGATGPKHVVVEEPEKEDSLAVAD